VLDADVDEDGTLLLVLELLLGATAEERRVRNRGKLAEAASGVVSTRTGSAIAAGAVGEPE